MLNKVTKILAFIDVGRVSSRAAIVITHSYFPIIVLIVLNICLGVYIVADYGESWDEANNKIYAEQSLKAYEWWGDKEIALDDYLGPTDQRYRGPAYPMLASLFVSLMQALNRNWFSIDLWHFASFLSFQLGIFFFYMICLRYVDIWAAFGTTLLFVTQPLLWGHAFINSKDIPLMVCFLGSIALGFKMVDAFLAAETRVPTVEDELSLARAAPRILVRQDWISAKSLDRKALIFFVGMILLSLLISEFIRSLIVGLITGGYYAPSDSILGILFSSFASYSDRIALEAYLMKGVLFYDRVLILVRVFSLGLLCLLLYRIFRKSLISIWSCVRLYWDNSFSKWMYLLMAALILGLAVSTRVSGAFAGALIAFYFLAKVGKKSIPALIVYTLLAIFVTYITWPYLWPNPVGNFIDSLFVSSDFGWTGNVLFQGVEYPSSDLPANYLPVLLALQFTEPICFLFCIGAILTVFKLFKRTNNWQELLVILAWFFVPFLCVIIFRPLMYDNFRHWLFILPPTFLLVSFTLDALFRRFRCKFVNLAFLLILLSPSIYWGIKLHPYQYIYYNSFVGGVNGAFRQFELDYWVTSYREATQYLNAEAPLDSQVLVVGPRRIFMSYAREDLNREWFTIDQLEETINPVYVIISTRYNADITQFPEAKVVYRVSRDGADLTIVKQLK